MDFILIGIVAFIASLITFFSGFGLGTILTPVFAIFFPIEIAIALTAIVHFLNNIFKLTLVFKNIDFNIVFRFGIPSIIGAIIGSLLLTYIPKNELLHYTIGSKEFSITLVKTIIGLLMIFFTFFEIIPALANLSFDSKKMTIGGIISGFFGGLTGNQGALRSAFLIKTGLSKETFIATGITIACLVDTSRLFIYSTRFNDLNIENNIYHLLAALLPAFIGAYLGNKFLKKATFKLIQTVVAVMIFIIGLLLILGII